MADQHNDNIPNAANVIAEDLVDIKENLEFHKDCFQAITTGWANDSTAALRIFPQNTVVLFGNKSAPTGWTKKTTWTDGAMIVVSSDADGTALDSGGAVKAQVAHTHDPGTFAGPSHNHQWYDYTDLSTTGKSYDSGGSATNVLSNTISAGTHIIATDSGKAISLDLYTKGGGTGSVTGTSDDPSALPYYQEVIACTKD